MNKIGFIGAGNMATAIIMGIKKAKLDVSVFAYDIDNEKLESLKEQGVIPAYSLKEMVIDVDYLFLAIKPQNFNTVLDEIKDYIKHDTVIVSIAAGVTEKYISSILSYDAKVVQVMPNTPLMLGYGATALCKIDIVSDDEFNFVKDVFSSSGITAKVPENKMNEIIAINGSSPAFIYEFTRCFIEYGKSVGIDEKVCLELFSQTLIGSAKMMLNSGKTIEELITMVSSKGGTTIAGLEGLAENNLNETVQNACVKCVKRAYELAK